MKKVLNKTSVAFTWHHVEDGVAMQLVPREINNPDFGGVRHRGGAANIRAFIKKMLSICTT